MQSSVVADDSSLPNPPYSAEQLRKWHNSMEPWPWLGQPEQKISLRDEEGYQLLLAISGYARGGTFVLFSRVGDQWLQISDEIEQAYHPLHILKTSKDGWHDFQSLVPARGSGGAEVWVSRITGMERNTFSGIKRMASGAITSHSRMTMACVILANQALKRTWQYSAATPLSYKSWDLSY